MKINKININQRKNGKVSLYDKTTKTVNVDPSSLITGFVLGIIASIIGGLIIEYFFN